jgi:hypothetical protein
VTTFLDDVTQASERVAAAKVDFDGDLPELRRAQKALHQALKEIDESWSQSNIGYHADLYFADFDRPALGQRFDPEWGGIYGVPERWADRSVDDIEKAVADRAGVTVDQFADSASACVDRIRQLVTDVCVSLAPLRLTQQLEREVEILDSLEAVDFAPAVPINVPGGMTRDSMAIAQGVRMAPHQSVRQRVRVAARALDVAEEALRDVDRLSRQVATHIRAGVAVAENAGVADAATSATVLALLRRFESAALALRDRQRGRAAFDITDEYDVQDLVHAFLRLHFDDVRPEEWSPSYLGAASRIDFLLKREGIVVEVKMAREGLGARRLGEELAVDVARYRAHPDARVLVCFVHDPENRISNPRGIEDDLAGLTDAQLEVAAVIA